MPIRWVINARVGRHWWSPVVIILPIVFAIQIASVFSAPAAGLQFGYVGSIHGYVPRLGGFSADGTRVVSLQDRTGEVRVLECATLAPVGAVIKDPSATCVGMFPDGKTVFTVNETEVHFWDVATSVLRTRIPVNATLAVVSPEGLRLATDGSKNACSVWDVATGAKIADFHHKNPVYEVVFSPSGKQLLTRDTAPSLDTHGESWFHLWDVRSGKELMEPLKSTYDCMGTEFSSGAAFNRDGRHVALADQHGFMILDIESKKVVGQEFREEAPVQSVVLSPNDDQAVLECKNLQFRDTQTGKLIAEFPTPTASCVLSPDGRLLLCGAHVVDGRWKGPAVFDLKTNEALQLLGDQSPRCVAFSPDGKCVILSHFDHSDSTDVWNVGGR